MSMHTPGPWSVDRLGMWVDAKRGMMRICDIRGWGHLTGIGAMHLPEAQAIEIQIANARLIAAAPELLEAAKKKLTDCRNYGDCLDAALMPVEYCSNECAALADAIEKASGLNPENDKSTSPNTPVEAKAKT